MQKICERDDMNGQEHPPSAVNVTKNASSFPQQQIIETINLQLDKNAQSMDPTTAHLI
jgi:hypothetical protein